MPKINHLPFVFFQDDDFCKDYLEISDVGGRKVSLYRGCSEISRPINILSGTHVVEVSNLIY